MAENLTDEQVSEFKEAFTVYDKDGSGLIHHDDLGTVVRLLGHSPTEADLAEMIEMVDRDREALLKRKPSTHYESGTVEFPEFLMLMANYTKRPDTETDIIGFFKVFDKEANGFISSAEIRHVLMNIGECLTDEQVDCMLQEADMDGDGHVNYEDFVKRMFGTLKM